MPFSFERTKLDSVVVIESEIFTDNRGFLLETYEQKSFKNEGINRDFILEFYSKSKQNVLRGLHQQAAPYQQAKLVRCFSGEILDVVVDVRADSPTYGEHFTYTLSDQNKHSLFVPRGFLHGFLTLSKEALVHYKVDNEYAPNHESGVIWNDPVIGIEWPIDDPIISKKDSQLPQLEESPYANA